MGKVLLMIKILLLLTFLASGSNGHATGYHGPELINLPTADLFTLPEPPLLSEENDPPACGSVVLPIVLVTPAVEILFREPSFQQPNYRPRARAPPASLSIHLA
jgi:hypothetical protein